MRAIVRGTLASLLVALVVASCGDSPLEVGQDFPLDLVPSFGLVDDAPTAEVVPALESLTRLQAVFSAAVAAGDISSKGQAESLGNHLEKLADILTDDDLEGDDDEGDDDDYDDEEDDDDDEGDDELGKALKKASKTLERFVRGIERLEAKGRIPSAVATALLEESARLEAALTGKVTPEAGGTVVADGGDVLLDVPAGALSQTVTITADPIPAPADDPNVLGGTTYDFGPDGTQFAVPVAVTLAYDPTSVPDGLPAGAVFIAKNVNGVWERVPGPVTVDPVSGTVTGELTSFSQYGVKADACALRTFGLSVTSGVTSSDCDFQGSLYEELYRIVTADLVSASGVATGGSPKLTLTTATDFNGVIGFKEATADPFQGLVYRYRGNLTAAAPTTFSMIAGDPEYQLFVGGQTQADFGSYTVTTDVAPGGDFTCGEVLVIAGSASFSSRLNQASSCESTIQAGPNVGAPLYYQDRYARLEAGKTYTVDVTGLAADDAVALFVTALPFGSGVDEELELSEGPNDPDRSITFTASQDGFYYIEVSVSPVVTDVAYDFAFYENPSADPCTLKPLGLQKTGQITASDCLFQGTNYEDLYRVVPSDLVGLSGQSFPGSPKLTLTATTDFNGVLGFKEAVASDPFAGLVYRFRNNLSAAGPVSFSMIGGDPEYQVFIGGLGASEFGAYTLETAVAPGGEISCGEVLVMAGSATFPSRVEDANSCAGTIQFGPFVGDPLIYQPRYARLEAGKTYTVTITGVTNDFVALYVAALPLSSGIDGQLDLSSGTGDTDRSITFTASQDGFYYIEVSSAPGETSDYTLTFGPG